MIKRILSLLLTLVMVLSMLPGNLVRAAEDNTDQIYIDDSVNFDEFTDMSDVDDGMFEELSDIPDILDIPEDKLDPPSTDNWIHEMSPDDTLGLLPDESTNVDLSYSEAESDVFQTEDENPVEGSGSLGGFVSGNMTQTNDGVPVDTSLTWYADEDGDDVDSSGIAINTQKGKPSFDGGIHTITIKPAEGTSTDATRLHINLYQLYAINNADVTVELDAAEFANYPLITEVVIHAVAAEEYLFYIRSGSSLTLQGLENCRIVVSGADVSDQAVSTRNLILLYSATSLEVNYAAFRYAPDKAVHSYGETLSFIRISNSIFESTCQSDNRGGAVYVSPRFRPGGEGSYYFTHLDEFTLTNCQFLGNTSGQTGGAVCLYGMIDQVAITGCKFSNTEITGENQFGGAIALMGVFENITINGEFEECTSAGYGGAIGLRASADQVSISGTFTECTSEKSGGAIYVVTSAFTANYYSFNQGASNYYSRIKALDITNSSFTSCSATGQGGALTIAAQINNVSLEGITFTGCSSTASSGGAVYFGSASLNEGYMWRDFTAEDDTHRDETGSYWSGDDRTTIGTVTIGDYTEGATPVHTSFTNCSAQSNGGAFIVSAQTCIDSFSIENTTISGCQSASSGGSAAFFSDSVVPKIEFDHCVISGCSVVNESGSGTVCVANSCTAVLTMTDCTFSGNTSGHSGGGIAWRARNVRTDLSGQTVIPTATLTRCTFTENTATRGYGGGVDCLARMSVIDCDFMSNTAVRGGGIALRIDDDDGLAMEDGETTSLSLDSDTVIAGNEAQYGGGVIVQANATKAINDDSTDSHSISFTLNCTAVRNNEASIHGGGICFVTITDADSSAEAAEATRFGKLVSIQNADIHDNIAGCYGGGLYLINDNNSNLSVDNCYIYGNACGTVGEYLSVNPDGTTTGKVVSTGGLGGGIYLKGNGSTVGITNCVIGAKRDASYTAAGNTAKEFYDDEKDEYYGGGGAGIAIEAGASVLLTGGRVVNNTAESIGGGIYIRGASTLTVNKGTFNGEEIIPQISNNTIRYLDEETIRDDGHGGGVAVTGSGAKLTLDNGVIKSNKAYGGSGIYVNSYGEVEVRNGGSIQSNTDATYGGGILANVNGHVLIVGGTITQNRASTGGGIYVNANSEVTVKSGTISSNTAEMNGGGIVAGASDNHGGSDVKIEGGKIINNIAGSKGGGVYATGGDSDSPEFASNVLITEGLIDNNTANDHGGGVYAGESCTVTINNGRITNNTAGYQGGGVTCSMEATLTLNGGTIAYNQAGSGGAIAALGEAKIFVNNGTVQENKAVAKMNTAGDGSSNGYGGGIYGAANSEITITGGTITKNRAKLFVYDVDNDKKGGGYGGGIAAVGGAKITVGRAQSAEAGEPAESVMSVQIIGNVAELNGGGIFASGNKSEVKDEDGNTVKDESGNIVYNTQQSNVTVNAGMISGNSAEEGDGGGIYATGATGVTNGSAVVTLNGGQISDNTSVKGNGGGIYTNIYASVTLDGGTISANTAHRGGGIYSTYNSSVTIIAGLITRNEANIEFSSSAGGAIYARSKATVTMDGGSVTLNKAKNGGGIYAIEDSTVTVNKGDITGNTAASNGAGVYANSSSTVTVSGGKILNNTAGNNGGGFYGDANSHLTISGGLVGNNKAKLGGGIYATGNSDTYNENGELVTEGARVLVSGGQIYRNTAKEGAGVYVTKGNTVTVQGGEISHNTASGNGGGICVDTDSGTPTVMITKAGNTVGKVMENKACNGGGVYVGKRGTLTVTGGHIINNQAVVSENADLPTTGYRAETLYGAGGGICVVGEDDGNATFILTEGDMAIYGNQAGFAGDEVFSNGLNTSLTVPLVSQMNLIGYDRKIVGWFEDYNTDDTGYTSGLNRNGLSSGDGVKRYRNSATDERQIIADMYVNGRGLTSGVYVNQDNAYVAMALGIPNADDALVVNKTVEGEGNKYTLTLEAFASGVTSLVTTTKPADIVLVLDQSASMYTPVGWSGDQIAQADCPTIRGSANGTSNTALDTDFEKQYAIADFLTEARKTDSQVKENAKKLGYYIAVHNQYNYIYLVQYAQNANGDWGWYYVSVDETTRSIASVDYESKNTSSNICNTSGIGYGTVVWINTASSAANQRDLLTTVTYYKSQYGALYDSVNKFVSDLSEQAVENNVDHRVSIVGFASPHYDGYTGYDGSGMYINGQYYLYDSEYRYMGYENSNSPYGYTLYVPNELYDRMQGILPDDKEGTLWTTGDLPDGVTEKDLVPLDPNTAEDYFVPNKRTTTLPAVAGADQYKSALMPAMVEKTEGSYSFNDNLTASIEAIKTNYLQTCPAIGLRMARSILLGSEIPLNDPGVANNNTTAEELIQAAAPSDTLSADRDRIIILFTDGTPTVSMYANQEDGKTENAEIFNEYWSGNGGVRDAINEANAAKREGIDVYTIGTAAASHQYGNMGDAATPETRVEFLDLVSSNYPDSNCVYDAIPFTDNNEKIEFYHLYVEYGNKDADNFALTINDNMNLATIFEKILETVSAPLIQLDNKAVLKDVLSDYVQLPDGDLTGVVKVFTAPFNADGTTGEPMALTGAVVTFDKTSDRYDIINVTGYDYGAEYYTAYPRSKDGADYYGSKLIVKIPVEPRDGFWGGNDVPTNTSDSGIYTDDGELLTRFPRPTMDVAFKCFTNSDTVVIDFGLPVVIDVIANDTDRPDFATATLTGVVQGDTLGTQVSDAHDIAYTQEAKSAHGTLTLAEDKLCYTPTDLKLDRSETFIYELELKEAEEETLLYNQLYSMIYNYATVTVIPASTIYYEDNCDAVTYHEGEGLAAWSEAGTDTTGTQDQDRPGISVLEGLDANNIYGYDGNFASTATYSNGSAHKVTVDRHIAEDKDNDGYCDFRAEGASQDCGVAVQFTHDWDDNNTTANGTKCATCLNTKDKHSSDIGEHECVDWANYNEYCDICSQWMGTHTTSARATFTFTGTGFDIVSLCNKNTGMVMVSVFKGEVANWDDPWTNEYVASYFVDTYYGYDYVDGKWQESANPSTSLYQVPVIKADLTKVMTCEDDPATENVDETEYTNYGYGTYSVEIYISNSFFNWEQGYWNTDFYLDAIRIYNPAGIGNDINDTVLNAYKEDAEAWPAFAELRNMFIDQKNLSTDGTDGIIFIDGKGENIQITDYITWGPNNEVYLNPGQSVAFTMDMAGYGQNVTGIHLGVRGLTGASSVLVQTGTDANNKTTLLDTDLGTTDLYYSIGTKDDSGNFIAAGKVVTISNDGAKPIAISNVKVTHGTNPNNSRLGSLFTSNMMTGYTALDILNAEQLADPVVTPKYPALSFDGMVCYNVFFSAEDLGDLTSADLGLAVFSTEDTEGTVETAREVIYGATEIDGLYMVTTKGVHAKYLGDRQYFRAFVRKADGSYVYSKMVSYSALDYANNVLAKSDDVKLKQLVVAMLNYGAEAQKFFDYKTEDLMNKALTADQQALISGFDAASLNAVGKVDASKVGVFASTGGFTKRYPAISFKGAFEINYFMAPANAVDGDMTLYFWNEDTYNSVTELTAENADKVTTMTMENGLYSASSDEIIAKNLDKTLYVAAVYESNGVTYCSGVLPYSIAAYCQKPPADVAALANAAAIYGCTAKTFFGA